MTKQIFALIIIAHPDDESFLLAGTSLKLALENKTVAIICATRGERGSSRLKEPLAMPALGKIRERELCEAARILKVSSVECLGYKDGNLATADFFELTNKLVRRIDAYAPQLILTFGREGISGHHDHITIGKAALAATRLAAKKPQAVWLVSMPRSRMKDFNEYLLKIRVHHAHFHPYKLKGVPDEKLIKVPIRRFRDAKLKALHCHKSQGLPPWAVHNFPKIRDLFLNAEYFEVVMIK